MYEEPQTTVAVVEDDADIVESLSFLLQDMGLRVLACSPTPDPYACIVEAQPRLIILDVRMGRIDGIDIFHQLRADPATRDIPVIFFTATEQRVSNRLPNFRQLGASFVIKPNIAQLSARIEEVLANHP